LIGLLLVLNVGVLAGGLAMTHWPATPGAAREFNGDKVKVLTSPAVDQPATSEGSTADLSPAVPPPASRATEPTPSCLSWPRLDADDLAAVEAHLKGAGVTTGDYELSVAKRLGWWVYLPPFPDTEALRVALENARQKGVTDLAPVRGGRMANALSLGAFPTIGKARAHAGALAARGLNGVRYGPRPEAGEVRLVLSGGHAGEESVVSADGWPRGLRPGVCSVGDAPVAGESNIQ
jgi:hypothetical protein